MEKKDNVLMIDGGIEVYEHDIYAFSDEFIAEELGGDVDAVRNNFMRLILYIRDRIPKPDNGDIELLDGIFDVYLHLCVKYGVLPTLESFSLLVRINRSTLSDWRNGEYRASTAHSNTVQKWFDICKSFVVERLHNAEKTNVNLIFTAKAAYQMRENSPEPIENYTNGIPQLSREEIAAQYAAYVELPEKPDLD